VLRAAPDILTNTRIRSCWATPATLGGTYSASSERYRTRIQNTLVQHITNRLPRAAPLLVLLLGQLAGPGSLFAQSSLETEIALRPGYHASWRTDRTGATSEQDDFRSRIQAGVMWAPSPALQLRVRAAGRLSDAQDSFRIFLQAYTPGTDGLGSGEVTLDELNLRLRPSDFLEIRVGRLQTAFELAGVARKSLDRNDSPNTDVTFTDGVHLLVRSSGWANHLIVQRNAARGPVNVLRPPLDFSGSGSRASLYLATQATAPLGPIVQRELSLTYLPASIPDVAGGSRENKAYVAAVGRLAVELPARIAGGRVVAAAEGGLAPNTPDRSILRTGEGASAGHAFQTSLNLMGAVNGKHSLGIVHARAGDGWLISPDIRENNREWEARYYWQYAPWGRFDARYRIREDSRLQIGAERLRRDADIYLRTSIRL
jgi:hypothetical protein